jgi:hypothetical protein
MLLPRPQPQHLQVQLLLLQPTTLQPLLQALRLRQLLQPPLLS